MASRDDRSREPRPGLGLEPAPRMRLSELLYTQMVRKLASDGFALGDRLPSERELGIEFHASRIVVRQALLRLCNDGYLVARKGAGYFVCSLPDHRVPGIASPELVIDYLKLQEVRIPLESEAAALAAERRDRHDIRRLLDTLAGFERGLRRGEPIGSHDEALHEAIFAATHNEYFTEMYAHLQVRIVQGRSLTAEFFKIGRLEWREHALEEHRALTNAIVDGDVLRASTAMRHHLHQVVARVKTLKLNRAVSNVQDPSQGPGEST